MLPADNDDGNPCDVDEFLQRAEEARQLARCRLRHQQCKDARSYNRHRRIVQYQPGDKVWVWTPVRRRGLSEKLLRRYFGPYEVIRRLSDLTYEVIPSGNERTKRPNIADVVHIVRMKPYYER